MEISLTFVVVAVNFLELDEAFLSFPLLPIVISPCLANCTTLNLFLLVCCSISYIHSLQILSLLQFLLRPQVYIHTSPDDCSESCIFCFPFFEIA